jgi:hypothetical protein
MSLEHPAGEILFRGGHVMPEFVLHDTPKETGGISRTFVGSTNGGADKLETLGLTPSDKPARPGLVEEQQQPAHVAKICGVHVSQAGSRFVLF